MSYPIITAQIDVIPYVGSQIKTYLTVIYDDASLNQADIINISVYSGNAYIFNIDTFIPLDTNPICIQVTGILDSVEYTQLLYVTALFPNLVPDNYKLLVQKVAKGVFDTLEPTSVQGFIFSAISQMINDYYVEYYRVLNQVYSFEYSPQLEFEYNGTIGLLSDSVHPSNLFELFASLSTVRLTTYDLELCVSRYIYYRKGITCAVYLNEFITGLDFWTLGIPGLTELDSTTILAPDEYRNSVKNLQWTIYNAADFSLTFQEEVTNFIVRISRADLGNLVTYSSIPDPIEDDFTFVGFTYPDDPRLLYERCLEFIGEENFPLNIVGYRKNIV